MKEEENKKEEEKVIKINLEIKENGKNIAIQNQEVDQMKEKEEVAKTIIKANSYNLKTMIQKGMIKSLTEKKINQENKAKKKTRGKKMNQEKEIEVRVKMISI